MPARQPKSILKSKPSGPLRQTRARSRLNNAPPLMQGLDDHGRAINPLSADPEALIYNDVVEKLGGRPKKKKKAKIIFRRSPSASPAPVPAPALVPAANPPSSSNQQPANSPSSGQPTGSSSPVPPTPQRHSTPPTSQSSSRGGAAPGLSSNGSSSHDSDGSGDTTRSLSGDERSQGGNSGYEPSSDDSSKSSGSSDSSGSPGSPGSDGGTSGYDASGEHTSSSTSSSTSSDSSPCSPPNAPSSAGSSDSSGGGVPLVGSPIGGSEEDTFSNASPRLDRDSTPDSSGGGAPLNGSPLFGDDNESLPDYETPLPYVPPPDSPANSSSPVLMDSIHDSSDGGAPLTDSLYLADNDSESSDDVPVHGSPQAGSNTSSTLGHLPPASPQRSSPVAGFSTPRPQAQGTRQARPADVLVSPNADTAGMVVQDNSLANGSPVNNTSANSNPSQAGVNQQHSTQEANRPSQSLDTSSNCSGSSLQKRRRSHDDDDDDGAPEVETKKRRLSASSEAVDASTPIRTSPNCSGSSPQKRRRSLDDDAGTKRRRLSTSSLVVETSTYTRTTVSVAAVNDTQTTGNGNSLALTSNAPQSGGASPIGNMASGSAKMAMPGSEQSEGSASGGGSPLILPPFDPEIPDLYGSGLRPRLHYDWYEQYHAVGLNCAKVHGCNHNPGRHCHKCHAEWHKAWSRYFKAEELLNEAAANPEKYLKETGLDMRKGYMGALMEGSGWEVLAPELKPPAGGKLRIHPARIAKHKLALAQLASSEE